MKHLLATTFACILFFLSCNSSKTTVATSPLVPEPPQTPLLKASKTAYWQQHVDYKMEIEMDVDTYQYKGKQELVYTNNSPDVLNKVFYHLYFNAFQPGSEMDVRSRTIADPDSRVRDRISKLLPHEIGYIKVNSLTQNGESLEFETVSTVLEVKLKNPIQPGEKVTFNMLYNAQVPKQIRRSGRNNKEGVSLSMTQWYPKMAEYDDEGWHADPYIGREFHSVWGDFEVKIIIDKNYIVGGSGYLQSETEAENGKKTLHYIAPKVHDFSWAADPDYIHDVYQMPNGPTLNFYYKKNLDKKYLDNWKKLQPKTAALMEYFNKHIGPYPYKQYSVVQGGDGGMEYAMCTLITGQRKFGSLVGVTAHELAHSWFQFVLAFNEAKHAWMDEGFTTYISTLAENELSNNPKKKPLARLYSSYIGLALTEYEQPMTTHSDRYKYNSAYSVATYLKGAVFLAQLGYVIGDSNLKKTIKQFFQDYKFTHPKPFDIIRTAERVSGLELDWYLTDFTQTINKIDYAIKSVENKIITLERKELMPMPIDLLVTYIDNTEESFYIPLQMMRGEKPTTATIIKDWAWAYPEYSFNVKKEIKSIQIDPSGLMADIDKANNNWQKD